MAFQTIPGVGMVIGPYDRGIYSGTWTLGTALTINATGNKIAFLGRVFIPDRSASKNIHKVGFMFGTIVKAGGSGLTVSLQNVSTSAGPPMQPDGTQAQTVAIANGDAGFASSVWYQTAAFSADRTVNQGDLVAVVIEFDGSGRLGSDSVILQGIVGNGSGPSINGASSLNTGGVWTVETIVPNVVLEFSDGTFGGLWIGQAAKATAAQTWSSSSSPNEYCLEFSLPFPAKIEGVQAMCSCTNSSSDFTFNLYDGTTVMSGGTITISARTCNQAGSPRVTAGLFAAPISLLANHTYRMSVKASSTNTITLAYWDVQANGHLQPAPGGATWLMNSCTGSGAWGSAVQTRRPVMDLLFSAFDFGGAPLVGGRLAGP